MPVIVLCLLTSNKNHHFCLLVSNKSTTFAPTRTRQASLQCLNRRVVLFLYDEQQNLIPETIRPMLPKSAICPQTLIIKPPVRSGEMLIGGGNS